MVEGTTEAKTELAADAADRPAAPSATPGLVKSPFRRKNTALRNIPAYLLGATGIYLAQPSLESFAIGVPLVAAGLGVRAWAAGHIVKTRSLTVTGPYAHLRNPLYLGTLLGALGACAAGGPISAAICIFVFVPFFFLHYYPRKERVEGGRLEKLYGEHYLAYRAAVPGLWPRLSAWEPPPHVEASRGQRWNVACYRENDELATAIVVGIILVVVALRPLLPI